MGTLELGFTKISDNNGRERLKEKQALSKATNPHWCSLHSLKNG